MNPEALPGRDEDGGLVAGDVAYLDLKITAKHGDAPSVARERKEARAAGLVELNRPEHGAAQRSR